MLPWARAPESSHQPAREKNGFNHIQIPGEEKFHMTTSEKCSLIAVGALVVSLVLAPAASAMPTCQDAGSHVRCETSGSVSIKAVPQTTAPHVGEITPNFRRRGVVWSW